ncbi:MAG: hypothetical protein COT43_01615 [Candidatus Marinimicrobia bacterium CG08_land_8_20_14_0_20_45_22]|nr:MAG: hypothetical protein COT43_01615 [Candidatus Marinimicrobia bacterium CG08_land_8_20_14_0_20_45_22]
MDLEIDDKASFFEHVRARIFPTDYLVLIYGAYLTLIALFFGSRSGEGASFLTLDFGVLVILSVCIYFERRDYQSQIYWIHVWIPILTLALFYTQSTVFDNLVFSQTFDPLLQKWDKAVFSVALNTKLAPLANSSLLNEIMHAFYFSYYFMLFASGLMMMLRRNPLIFEMFFTIATMAYLHYIFFMLFPSDGPIDLHSQLFEKGSLFIPLMDFIYQTSGQQGGGAFPSTHVSTMVIITIFTAKFNRKSLWLTIPVTVGIIIATVYCSYHYAIDALAGIVSGYLCYLFGHHIYSNWKHPSELPIEQE